MFQSRENFLDKKKKKKQLKLGHLERDAVGLEGGVLFAFNARCVFVKKKI